MNNPEHYTDISEMQKKYTNKPWIEKYRPSEINNVMSHDNIKFMLKQYIRNKVIPNILLFGSSGIGKTSLIKACARELYGEYVDVMTLEINASEERGVEIVRTTITQFARSIPSFNWDEKTTRVKLIILDEVDSMTAEAQLALRNVIDTYSKHTRFCLICNCIKKITYSLISRCVKFRMHPLKHKQIIDYAKFIVDSEKINITDDAINEIIKYSNGDMRKVINVLQSIHTTYSHVDLQCIRVYLNKISYDDIQKIIKCVFNENINTSYKLITKYIDDYGYSLFDIINYVGDILLMYSSGNLHDDECLSVLNGIEQNDIYRIIKNIGKNEFQIFSNISVDILILSFISSCKLT